MSHAATNWALQRRGISPAAKVVLWHLADRFNPDHGCFPSQELLANDCEMSRSSLNNQITSLEKAALIRREQRRDEKTRRQLATRYRFAFEADFTPAEGAERPAKDTPNEGRDESPKEADSAPETTPEPSPNIGHGEPQETAKKPSPNIGHGNGEKPCPNSGQSRVQNLDSNPVREPVKTPPNPPAGGEGEDSGFEDFKSKYGMPGADWSRAKRKWEKLEPAARRLFIEAAETYRRRCEATTETQITPARFLGREEMAAKICAEAVVVLDHWTRGWWAWFFAQLDAGAPMGFTWQMACRRGGTQSQTVKAGEAPSAEARGALVQVLRGTEAGQAWAKWLADRKFVLPDFEGKWHLWMPSEWPDDKRPHGKPNNGGDDDAGPDDGASARHDDGTEARHRRYG